MKVGTPAAAALSGASLRQLDYWSRMGIFSGAARAGGGSGTQRHWDDIQLVLLRAMVELGNLWGVPRYRYLVGAEDRLRSWAEAHNGRFDGCWMVLTTDHEVTLMPRWARAFSPAACIIDLEGCQDYVTEVRAQLGPLLRAAG
jgi:hypothetical protein